MSLPENPVPAQPSEESLKDEDAFNDWNRDIDDYAPSLFEAYSYGLTCARSEIAKVRVQAAMAGELADALRRVAEPSTEEHYTASYKQESCGLIVPLDALTNAESLLARFEATKSTKEAT